MPRMDLHGWYVTGSAWVKMQCTAAGKLIADITGFLENPPTEDEAGKAATSEWSFDHDADAAAHHAKYTDVESRAAINNIFGADGKMDADLNMDSHTITQIKRFTIKDNLGAAAYTQFYYDVATHRALWYGTLVGGAYADMEIWTYSGTTWLRMAREAYVDAAIIASLENPPTDTAEKAATSAWSKAHADNAAAHHAKYTDAEVNAIVAVHTAIVDAHHAKYTDAEAQAACNLDGTLYASWPGHSFQAGQPDTDQVFMTSDGGIRADADGIGFVLGVNLPEGATVTGVKVYGNAAAEAETWQLKRVSHADGTSDTMANENIGTIDNTITNPVITNSGRAYFLTTTTLDTNDIIYSLLITYTL